MGDRWRPDDGQRWLKDTEKRIDWLERRWNQTGEPNSSTFGNTRFGTVTGITSTGVTVTLEDGFGNIVAQTRARHYTPVVGERVMVIQSGTNYHLLHPSKPATAVRLDLPLSPTWVRYGLEVEAWNSDPAGPFAKPVIYKTSNGTVKLSGLVRKYSGTFVNGEKIATLPVGYRPDSAGIYPAYSSNPARTRIAVDTDGSIYAVDGPTDGTFLSLEGIIFPTGLTWTTLALQNSFVAQTTSAVPGGPTMTIPLPSYALDSNGITWTRGSVLRSADPAGTTPIVTYPVGAGPVINTQAHIGSAGHTATTFGLVAVGIAGSTSRNRSWIAGSSRGMFFDGTPFVSESSPLTPYGATAAVPIPLQPQGTTSYSSNTGWLPRAFLTPQGMVFMAGLSNGGVGTIGWMGPDLRPFQRLLFPSTANAAAGRMDIAINGKATVVVGTVWHALDGVFYMADTGTYDLIGSGGV